MSYSTTSAQSAEDARALADLIKERLASAAICPAQIASLRVDLGQLYAGQLKTGRWPHELGEKLRLKADQPAALYMLGKTARDDSEWQHAIDPLRRYGQMETVRRSFWRCIFCSVRFSASSSTTRRKPSPNTPKRFSFSRPTRRR